MPPKTPAQRQAEKQAQSPKVRIEVAGKLYVLDVAEISTDHDLALWRATGGELTFGKVRRALVDSTGFDTPPFVIAAVCFLADLQAGGAPSWQALTEQINYLSLLDGTVQVPEAGEHPEA